MKDTAIDHCYNYITIRSGSGIHLPTAAEVVMNKYLSRNLLASSILSAMLVSQAYAQGNSGAATTSAPPASTEQAPDASTNRTDASKKQAVQLQNVTVTAQRRQELVQKVPISITTLNAVQLQRMNVTRLDDMKFVVPNVVIEQNTALNT
ncbi:MAG: hypothetical protein ABI178_05590, partial [Rhodanobacter sp.]